MTDERSVRHLPVPLFAAVMGIAGLSLAWRRAAHLWSVPAWIGDGLFWLALLVYVVLLIGFTVKAVRFPDAALAEWKHPIKIAFFPAITVATLLVATAGSQIMPAVATVLWWIGAVGHLALALVVITKLFDRPNIGVEQVTPVWFIPIVGNVVTPLGAAELGSVDFAWVSFAIGVVFWLAFMPLILWRVVLHERLLPPKMLPSLTIFVAPPAVSATAWVMLGGDPAGILTRILWGSALGFLGLVLIQVPTFVKLPFVPSFWAHGFPLAAMAVSSLVVAGALGGVGYHVIAALTLALVTLVVAVVFVLTLVAAVRGSLFLPE